MKIATRRKIVGGVVAAIFGTPVVALGVLIPQFGGVLALVGLVGLVLWSQGMKRIEAGLKWICTKGFVSAAWALGIAALIGLGIWGIIGIVAMGPVVVMLFLIYTAIIWK
jgi:hypothetical protein